jgi:haloacid dehalogenase-like hydrolase
VVVGLDSWHDTATRVAIEDFVARVCDEAGPDHVPPEGRIVVADNDGTLWCEKPMPIQLDFTIRRLGQLAADDPSLGELQPYKAARDHDLHWFGAAMVKHYQGDDSDMTLLMEAIPRAFDTVTIEEYDRSVSAFFGDAEHPTMKIPYLRCAFAPMVELIRFLEAYRFTIYIASGGDRDFMRPVAGSLYGVPPERVIGSALGLTFRSADGRADLLYKSEMDFFDDGEEKPIRIWSRIGRRPIVSIGNSNGDLPMLEFSGAPDGPALRLLVLHDDDEREFAYTAGAEDVLARARAADWTVVSMKDDWRTVFG